MAQPGQQAGIGSIAERPITLPGQNPSGYVTAQNRGISSAPQMRPMAGMKAGGIVSRGMGKAYGVGRESASKPTHSAPSTTSNKNSTSRGHGLAQRGIGRSKFV